MVQHTKMEFVTGEDGSVVLSWQPAVDRFTVVDENYFEIILHC